MRKDKKTRRKSKFVRRFQFQSKRLRLRLKAKEDESNPVRKVRKEKVKRRKNFFSSLLLIVLLLTLMFCFLYFVDPDSLISRISFFIFVFLVVLFIAAFVFANSRRGLITAFVITAFLVLRLLGIGNVLNLILLVGLAICIDYYKS